MHTEEHPNDVAVQPLMLGEIATHRENGDVILADSGATLMHIAHRTGCLHVVLSPREARWLGLTLLAAARVGRRNRRRGV